MIPTGIKFVSRRFNRQRESERQREVETARGVSLGTEQQLIKIEVARFSEELRRTETQTRTER